MNETEFLVHQIRAFLDAGNYDNEQLSNVSLLMDNICQLPPEDSANQDSTYPISVNINVTQYSNASGKAYRCRAIDESMDAMYSVFRRAALNKSEPLDFSVIQFHPNATNKAATYNLTDLINTSWIKSDTLLEHVCKISDSVKLYVQMRSSNSTVQDRSQQNGVFSTLMDLIDRILDPILGVQKRLYWDSNNQVELIASAIGKGFRNTRARIVGLFSSASGLAGSGFNSTGFNATNKELVGLVNTTLLNQTNQVSVTKPTA